MATNFPTSLDTLSNPSSGDTLSSPSHSSQHADANDAIEALQAKVGVNGSAITTSLDYKVSQAATLTGTQTLTNKTLTAPRIASIVNTGTLTLPTSTDTLVGRATTDTLTNKTLTAPRFADLGFIADANGNELIILDTVTSAVNEVTLANAATGNSPTITASGGDTNVSLNLVPKGTGTIQVGGIPVVTTTGTQTLTNKTLTGAILDQTEENWNIVASAATGTIDFNILTASIWYYTGDATANHTVNVRGDASTTLSSLLAVGDSITVVWVNTNGTTAYYPSVFQIDGVTVTPKWLGGTAPTSGYASSVDFYTYSIVKLDITPTYSVFASQSSFK